MKKVILLVLYSAFLFACNNASDSEKKETTTSDTTAQYSAPASLSGTATDPVADPSAQTVQTGQPVSAQSAQTPPAASSTAAGMNPAHGQPGHRCDIAVGAPLNSAPVKKEIATPTVTQSPVTHSVVPVSVAAAPSQSTSPAPTQAMQPTAAGMNPPHGQPGHDCAIPVGSPLKK
jgi:hypothetical protein